MENKVIMTTAADIHLCIIYPYMSVSLLLFSSQIFSSKWKWDVKLMMTVIEVIAICLAGYSVRSWSRLPRGTAPLLLEGRQRASMSRL